MNRKQLLVFVLLSIFLVNCTQARGTRGIYEIAEVPDVSYDKILEAIVAQHRGKPVFVDFWGTFCGPCLRARETMSPLKAEMRERGVVEIYFVSQNSPRLRWRRMLPDIGGIHYYLTNVQWTALQNKYQFPGVPTYMIFNREGEKTFQSTGFPGNERMREELERVW